MTVLFRCFQALISAHDDVANENYIPEPPPTRAPSVSLSLHSARPPVFNQATEEHRLVTITKKEKDVLVSTFYS